VSQHGQDENVSIPEASARFGVSEATLRRRLLRGEIAGSFKVKGKRGTEWRVPIGSLRALGYEENASESVHPEHRDLEVSIRNLTEALRVERARSEEWDRRLGWAQTEIARLGSELRHERGENRRLRTALEDLRRADTVIDLEPETPDPSRPTHEH
jgi:hypothetical protein